MPKNSNNTKTAAVYDRWLNTLGGGEQVAFAYVETLRELGYTTKILTHSEIDIPKAEAKMGVQLHDIEIIVLPLMSSQQLAGYTEKYDIFINTSYLDYFPNRSKCGILSIFFPSQIFLTPYEYIKRAILLPSFSHFFIYPSQFEGFQFDEYKQGIIYKWLGEKSSIVFNKNIQNFSITLFCRTMAISLIDDMTFSLANEPIAPIKKHLNDRNNQITFYFSLKNSLNKRFTIHLPNTQYAQEVALIRLTINSIRFILYNIFKKHFPKWEMRLHGGPGVTKLSDLTSYQHLITISEFSKKWIHRYWGLESKVLYPPVNVESFSTTHKKKQWITHVGRFFVTGHNKKQLELIKAFRKLVDNKKIDNWELHFVGSVAEGEKHLHYFNQCQFYAQGYPVFFHTDVPFSELREILAQSKIYWHATGLNENENKSPILFEHFGITTVEAMASGCVPVVISAGGQKEIVTPSSGFVWTNIDDLVEKTYLLTQDSELLTRLKRGAIERAQYFSRAAFRERFQLFLKK